MKSRWWLSGWGGVFVFIMALPSIVGATASTHVWAPSTDVQPFKLWHATIDMYSPTERIASIGHIPTVTNVGLTVGVFPWKKLNAEIGFDHKTGLGTADKYPLYGNIKIGVPENSFGSITPALAVGVFDVGTKADVTDYNVFYAKGAKTVTIDSLSLGRISLGYFSGNEKLLLDENGQVERDGLLFAWERTFTEISDKLWICLEYMGSHSGYGTWNVGGAWKFAPNVGVILGYDMFNNSQLPNVATVQVDIDF